MINDVPHRVMVHPCITMDKLVSERHNLRQGGNAGRQFGTRLGQLVQRLANDLKLALYRRINQRGTSIAVGIQAGCELLGPVNAICANANGVKTVPIKARNDAQTGVWARSATQSGAVFTPFPPGCDQKGPARRCKALSGFTPPAFCALPRAFLTRNASCTNSVNRP